MKISFNEYDKICAKLETMPPCNYTPSLMDIARIKADFNKYYLFAIYVCEYHSSVEDPEETANLTALKKVLYENLEISE